MTKDLQRGMQLLSTSKLGSGFTVEMAQAALDAVEKRVAELRSMLAKVPSGRLKDSDGRVIAHNLGK